MMVVSALQALPADCVTRAGYDCSHDEGSNWDALAKLGLIVEIIIGLAVLVIVSAILVWARKRVRTRIETGDG
ncbi:MAG: hypothetical protein QOF67_432 [Mycobacterium sp.]|nr:hypothetical protein [Mycobacterium sp.]